MEGSLFFRHRPGRSVLHRMDAAAKLACAAVLSALSFAAPPAVSAAALVLAVAANALVLRSTPREILSDLKPAAAYALLLSLATLALNAAEFAESGGGDPLEILRPNAAYVPLMLGTAAALQITALLYRSTSTVQLRESFARIERLATRREDTPAADTMSLALSFLPAVARLWTRLECAWRARGGRESPGKIARLAPRLLRAAMREAYEKSLAIQART